MVTEKSQHKRLLTLLIFSPAYLLLGIFSSLVVMLLLAFVFGKVTLLREGTLYWDQLTPGVLHFPYVLSGFTAYVIITLIDRLFKRTSTSDRIVLALLTAGILYLVGWFWGVER